MVGIVWLTVMTTATVALPPDVSLDEAMRLFDAGSYDQAVVVFDRVIRAEPSNIRALYYRGEAHRKSWRLTEAEKDFARVIQLDPRHASAHLARGLIFEYKAYADRAASDYAAATRLDSKLPLPWIYHGRYLWRRGEMEKATADLNRGIELCNQKIAANSNDLQAYRARALAYNALEQYDRAIDDYGQMIRIDPKSVEAYIERGRSCVKKNDKFASVADFDQAIKLATSLIMVQPGNDQVLRYRVEAYDARAFAWKDPNDFARAIIDCEALLTRSPNCATLYFRRGHLLAGASHFSGDPVSAARQFSQAEKDLGQTIKLDRTFAAAWHERGLLYLRAALRQQQPKMALRGVKDLTEMVKLVPNAALAYCARGSAYGLAGNYRLALADFDKAVQLCPKLADAHALRSGANLALGNDAAAQADMARANELRTRRR